MDEEIIYELEVEDIEFTFTMKKHSGIPLFNLDGEKGGYVFLKKSVESKWITFAKWFDRVVLKNKVTFHPDQWIDISWFEGSLHHIRSYRFIPLNKADSKETIAAYAASLGMLYCFLQKENPLPVMPEYIQVHYKSIFGHKTYMFGKVNDCDVKGYIVSSFLVCKSMVQKHCQVSGGSSLH